MKYFKLLTPIVLFLALSCSKKQASSVSQSQSVNTQLLDEIENLNTKSAKKISYAFLNKQERLTLWQRHLSYYLDADLSSAQKAHIQSLLKYISAETFADDVNLVRLEEFTKPWMETAKQLFEKSLLNDLVSDIHPRAYSIDFVSALKKRMENSAASLKTATVVTQPVTNDSGGNCSCSTKSDYCDAHMQCTLPSGGCTQQSGCGTLWSYTCNGNCLIIND